MRFLQIVKGMNVYYLLRMGIIIGNRKRAFRLFSKPVERNKDCHILTVDSYQVHCPSIHSRRTDNCQMNSCIPLLLQLDGCKVNPAYTFL